MQCNALSSLVTGAITSFEIKEIFHPQFRCRFRRKASIFKPFWLRVAGNTSGARKDSEDVVKLSRTGLLSPTGLRSLQKAKLSTKIVSFQ